MQQAQMESALNQLADILAKKRGRSSAPKIQISEDCRGEIDVRGSIVIISPIRATLGSPIVLMERVLDVVEELERRRAESLRREIESAKEGLRISIRILQRLDPEGLVPYIEDLLST